MSGACSSHYTVGFAADREGMSRADAIDGGRTATEAANTEPPATPFPLLE